MALGFEATRSEKPSLANAAMDLLGIRRADRSSRAGQNLSPSPTTVLRWQFGLAPSIASIPFTAMRAILDLHASLRCGDRQLHGSQHEGPENHDASLHRSTMPGKANPIRGETHLVR